MRIKFRFKKPRKKPISRQASWRKRMKEEGRCIVCGQDRNQDAEDLEERGTANHCPTHRDAARRSRLASYYASKD